MSELLGHCDNRQTFCVLLFADVGDVVEVNDTVIGDPLFTVPVVVPEEQLAAVDDAGRCLNIGVRVEQCEAQIRSVVLLWTGTAWMASV